MSNDKKIDTAKLAGALIRKYGWQTMAEMLHWIDIELEKLHRELEEDIQYELDFLDDVDEEVSLMERYPDAENMLEKLKRDYLS